MDLSTILSAIGSVGFPIVACIAMAFFFSQVNTNYRDDIKEITKQHKEENAAMTEAINNNTMALTRLYERLGGDQNDRTDV